MFKFRTLSAGVLCALGLSIAGALTGPAIALAAPGHPGLGPMRPGAGQMHRGMGQMRPEIGQLRPQWGEMRPHWGEMRQPQLPTHPIDHYGNDLTHPVWSATHPVRTVVP
ncbi:hypothetical protein MB901379_03703 [Mycobacterium basiliense]|uniref:Uncharacterized protein n=1 Tax=Mycobacterium basiliense TaxID=2094119 RepID=A0A3S4BYG7_9MYCO|nr:hypothetical protein [Mycobacterium basiliense]VDM90110.1 hypothetical protein MB901379_03703 [Mycobacterium basiliense]